METPYRRLVIIGPESVGKSTLAFQLSQELGVPHVAEYGREFVEKYGPTISELDLIHIAHTQKERQDQIQEFCVCDTDVIATWIFAQLYFPLGTECHKTIQRIVGDPEDLRRDSFYLLLSPNGCEPVQDGTRDWISPNSTNGWMENPRDFHYDMILGVISNEFYVDWFPIDGPYSGRLDQARGIAKDLKESWDSRSK